MSGPRQPKTQPRAAGRPAEEAEVTELVLAVRRTNMVLDAGSVVAQAALGIGRSDLAALELLTISGKLTAGDIADQLSISTGTATAVVDRLTEAGYAVRSADAHDRRRILVSITQKGRRRFQEAFQQRWQWLHEVASDLSSDELATVVRFLLRLHEIMPEEWRQEVSASLPTPIPVSRGRRSR